RLLHGRKPEQLAAARPELEKLATQAKRPITRQLGFISVIAVDKSTERAWGLGMKSVTTLQDLVTAIPLIRDPNQRTALYPKVEELLKGLPKELHAAAEGAKQARGRYVRIELPGKGKTLTLAEVEVYSDGRNVARQGKASQKNTAHGGVAS